MNKCVLFDLDGTLLYTLGDICLCVNKLLSNHNMQLITEEDVRVFIGHGAKYLVKCATKLPDGELLDSFHKEYVEYQKECKNELTCLYPGLDELLTKLKKEGYKLGILSNKPDEVTQVVYEEKLKKYNFDFVTGNNPKYFKTKPDREAVMYSLDKLGVTTDEVIYIGDSDVDVTTSLNAGIPYVIVLWGYRTKEQIMEVGGNNFANTAEELYIKIKEWK